MFELKNLDLVEYYNFGLACISSQGHLKNSKNLNFKAMRTSLVVSNYTQENMNYRFRITLKKI